MVFHGVTEPRHLTEVPFRALSLMSHPLPSSLTLAGNSASAVIAELIRTGVAGAIPCFASVTPSLSKMCIANPTNSTSDYKH